MDSVSRTFVICLGLFSIVHSTETEDSSIQNQNLDVLNNIFARSLVNETAADRVLIENWQDYVLSHAMLANYLNILMVYASRADFSLAKTPNQCTKYLSSSSSFRQAATQLNDNIRIALVNLFGDVNRVAHSLDGISLHLKTTLLLIKKGSNDTIDTNLSPFLQKGYVLMNNSLGIIRQPSIKISEIKDLVNELESLVKAVNADYSIILQIEDIQDQWLRFSDLFAQLSIQAENAIDNFRLQFVWILDQLIPLKTEDSRNLILSLLQSKAMEVDRITDLLSIIAETYADIANDYANEKITSNTHAILTSSDKDRLTLIKQDRYELQPRVVKYARLALKRHDEFLNRTQNRQNSYEQFLNEMSKDDLDFLLSEH